MNNTKTDYNKTKDVPVMSTKKAEPAAHKPDPSVHPTAESCGTPDKTDCVTTDKMACVTTDKDAKVKSDMPKASVAKAPDQSAAHK
jgi:hypothetical protein